MTDQIESSAPSTAAALEEQATALLREVLMSAGIDPDRVAAAVKGLEQGVASRQTRTQPTLRAAIRRGLDRAVEQYYSQLRTALPLRVGGDAQQRADIARMVDAARIDMLKAVAAQAPA
ncbi:MAG TPA: hypothetical protein VLJ86_15590 [Ramlibacter sp.]|nr:hypothetical protein [Ramlibacter sp.]